MDMITEGLLAEFSKEFQIEALQEDKRFEHLCGFVVKRHYSETFDPKEIVVGAGGDLGIDAIGIVVNGILVTDRDQLEDMSATILTTWTSCSSSFKRTEGLTSRPPSWEALVTG